MSGGNIAVIKFLYHYFSCTVVHELWLLIQNSFLCIVLQEPSVEKQYAYEKLRGLSLQGRTDEGYISMFFLFKQTFTTNVGPSVSDACSISAHDHI